MKGNETDSSASVSASLFNESGSPGLFRGKGYKNEFFWCFYIIRNKIIIFLGTSEAFAHEIEQVAWMADY